MCFRLVKCQRLDMFVLRIFNVSKDHFLKKKKKTEKKKSKTIKDRSFSFYSKKKNFETHSIMNILKPYKHRQQ